MIFEKTSLPDACIIDLNKIEDERGFFARTFCAKEFQKNGFKVCVVSPELTGRDISEVKTYTSSFSNTLPDMICTKHPKTWEEHFQKIGAS